MKALKTGTIILAIIGEIFVIDAILSYFNIMTISEWFNVWIHSGWQSSLVFISVVAVLYAHFWGFNKK